MAADDLYALQSALDAWPNAPALEPGLGISDSCRRAMDALAGMTSGRTGWADIAGLIRQVLITTEARIGGHAYVVMRVGRPWPTVQQWSGFDCPAIPVPEGRVRVSSSEWLPVLAPGEPSESASGQVRQAYERLALRDYTEIPADPFWTAAHGLPTYRGEAQRQAARAAVLAAGGETLLLTLPTGRGKTAVAWSKMLLTKEGVTVVVVPTVVLALDMERRTKVEARDSGRILSPVGRYAYTGSMDDDTKRTIRDAVRTGAQRVLYTSPEALVSGLAPAVLDCARAGHLQQVVVDEAHLVEQWGQDFRPEFQSMAGLVRDAVEAAPTGRKPEIILMSATLTTRQIQVLRRTFAPRSDSPLVWGASLRHEPSYFVHEFGTVEERDAEVLSAIHHLPKPLVLYTTRVDDAEAWQRRLQDDGFQRVGLVTGRSSEEQRQTAVEKWRGQLTDGSQTRTTYDIVVGTSAFGLGIDVPNVRTVIHACIPETIDRYYQEVGRAGRDGYATISVLYACKSDWGLARRLNSVTLIGDTKGLRRWHALRSAMDQLSETRYRVHRSTLPTYLEEGFGRSAAWNVKTLSLMAQAGIIQFCATTPPIRGDELSDADWQDTLDAFWSGAGDLIDFELVSGLKLQDGEWKTAMQGARTRAQEAQGRALSAMEDLVRVDACTGVTLADYYSIEESGALLHVTPSCRGCPWCRKHPEQATGLNWMEPLPLLPRVRDSDPLSSWRGDEALLFIWWDGEEERHLLEQLLVALARRGLGVASGLGPLDGQRLQAKCLPFPMVTELPDDPNPLAATWPEPIIHIQQNDTLDTLIVDRVEGKMATYVVGPSTLQDPRKPGWPLRDTAQAIRLTTLLRGI